MRHGGAPPAHQGSPSCCAIQYGTVWYNTIESSTGQDSTVQYMTGRYSTVLYYAIKKKCKTDLSLLYIKMYVQKYINILY